MTIIDAFRISSKHVAKTAFARAEMTLSYFHSYPMYHTEHFATYARWDDSLLVHISKSIRTDASSCSAGVITKLAH